MKAIENETGYELLFEKVKADDPIVSFTVLSDLEIEDLDSINALCEVVDKANEIQPMYFSQA